jgi:hypothetical protein
MMLVNHQAELEDRMRKRNIARAMARAAKKKNQLESINKTTTVESEQTAAPEELEIKEFSEEEEEEEYENEPEPTPQPQPKPHEPEPY